MAKPFELIEFDCSIEIEGVDDLINLSRCSEVDNIVSDAELLECTNFVSGRPLQQMAVLQQEKIECILIALISSYPPRGLKLNFELGVNGKETHCDFF